MKRFLNLIMVGAISFAAFLVFFAPDSFGAGYMKLGDIKGESTDKGHEDWIIIESTSSPISRPGKSARGSAARASGKRLHSPIVVTKKIDRASPMLQQASTSGKSFPEADLHIQANEGSSAAAGSRATYLKYKLKNVMITSYRRQGGPRGDSVPTETFSLNFEEIKVVGPAGEEIYPDKPSR